MCSYCPQGSLFCCEPPSYPDPRCRDCQAEVAWVDNFDRCEPCAEAYRLELAADDAMDCTLCGDAHDPDADDRALRDVLADVAREDWIDALELALPWERGWAPANDSLHPGEAA